jgi:NTE family protein
MHETPLTALVLSGGGARAAYQVGVLRALVRIRRSALGPMARLRNPFGVICGTSAGAINAAALACQADRFEAAVEVVAQVWRQFRADQVYRADSLGVIRSGAQWLSMLSLGWAIARWRRARPRSLLDNTPLAGLLQRLVPWNACPSCCSKAICRPWPSARQATPAASTTPSTTARSRSNPGSARSGWPCRHA